MPAKLPPAAMNRALGERLVERGALTRTQLGEVSERATLMAAHLDELLVKEAVVEEDRVLEVLSEISGLPFRRIAEFEITPRMVQNIPVRIALHYSVLPLAVEPERLTLACSRIFETSEEESLRAMLGRPLDWVLCTRRDIGEAIKHFYGLGADMIQEMISAETARAAAQDENAEGGLTASPRVTKFVLQLIQEAVQMEASDVHIEPFENRLRLRYRVDGVMHDIPMPHGIESLHKSIVSAIKVMAQLDIAERRLPHDGRIRLSVDSEDLDLRVSILPTQFGEAVNMRVLNRETTFLELKELGLRDDQEPDMEAICGLVDGIVLITGPTGSGKTTTLYATLARMNNGRTSIITIEDPIEYQINGITQIQVNPKVGLDFASGLRSILRHDPDVILVGEIRDSETADIAIRSALTGHLVLSTLHTNDSAGAIVRLVDMGIEPYLVASSVEYVLAQRLLRRICPACREEIDAGVPVRREVEGLFPERRDDMRFYQGKGCPDCKFTGYHGRFALFEIMAIRDPLRRLIVQQPAKSDIWRVATAGGMRPLRQSGWQAVLEGLTTVEDVLRVTRRAEE